MSAERLTWKPGEYSGHYGYAGRIRLFSVTWRSDDPAAKWALTTDLPGIYPRLGMFAYEDDAKAKAERVLTAWLREGAL